MDGTLLNDEMEVPEDNTNAIKRAIEQGVEVVLATGRTMSMVEEFVEPLGLQSYLVTVNGGEIWTVDNELLDTKYLQTEDIENMLNLADNNDRFYDCIVIEEN